MNAVKNTTKPVTSTKIDENNGSVQIHATLPAAKTEEKPEKKRKDKPGLKSHLAVLKALEAGMTTLDGNEDPHAVKLLNDFIRVMHRRMRPWAKVTMVFEEK